MNKSILPSQIAAAWNRAKDIYKKCGWSDAKAQYEQICSQCPDYADAWIMLGLCCERLSEIEGACRAYESAVRAEPNYAEAHFNLARVLQQLNRPPEAETQYKHATRLKSDYAEAYNNYGLLLFDQGRFDEAIVMYRKGLSVRPQSAQMHYNLALALESNRAMPNAVWHYKQSLRLEPNRVATLVNYASAILELGHPEEAERASRHAIVLEESNAEAHLNLAKALAAQGQIKGADTAYESALSLDPKICEHQGVKALFAGMTPEAVAARKKFNAVDLYAQYQISRMDRCDWSGLSSFKPWFADLLSERLQSSGRPPVAPFSTFCLNLEPDVFFALTRSHAKDYENCKSSLSRPFEFSRSIYATDGRLSIAYVSADYRDHNHGQLIHNLFEKHDRSRFKIIAYSLKEGDGGAYRQAVIANADVFREVGGQTGLRIARRIHDDGVHILVDLNGYTLGSRPDVFALRTAPIQTHYPVAYPGSLGADFIDYLVCDRNLVPQEMEAFYRERLVFLPEGYPGQRLSSAHRESFHATQRVRYCR